MIPFYIDPAIDTGFNIL